MSYYYYPPPPPPPRRHHNVWALVIVFVAAFIATMLVGAIYLWRQHQGPAYTPTERDYLSQLHQTPYSWNGGDGELVREGHAICSTLDSNGGNRTVLYETQLFSYGPDPMPDFLQVYGQQQRYKMVVIATDHFCNQYTLYLGGLPF